MRNTCGGRNASQVARVSGQQWRNDVIWGIVCAAVAHICMIIFFQLQRNVGNTQDGQVIALCAVACVSVPLIRYDMMQRRLPNMFLVPCALCALAVWGIYSMRQNVWDFSPLLVAVVWFAVGVVFALSIHLGMGDVKLLALLGFVFVFIQGVNITQIGSGIVLALALCACFVFGGCFVMFAPQNALFWGGLRNVRDASVALGPFLLILFWTLAIGELLSGVHGSCR